MNVKLIGLTTESINFTNNSFRKEIKGMFPVGTMIEIDRQVQDSEEALAALKRERAEATRAALAGGVTQYRVAQATGRRQSAVAQWRKMK